LIDAANYPRLARVEAALLAEWPEHARFLQQSFATRDESLMRDGERLAEMIVKIVEADGSLSEACGDYKFLCGRLMEEELHFRRHGAYRLSRFQDAIDQVYANAPFMARYMNFLILSYLLWDNHARAIAHFEHAYLPALPAGTAHLEIGPGHGLLLHLAANAPQLGSVAGWDISRTSIERTRGCLAAMGGQRRVDLVERDLFASPDGEGEASRYGSVVLAEILEHLEDPVAALKAVARHMQPGARLWVHVPVNSPAPDHIYLLRTPEEAVDLVRAGGFEPTDAAFYPMSGQTLERARKRDLTISAVVSARLTG
jgi:2-polyprenyl-3-methyl-5-hydroxy-6-metoxy-1,4-benzoquinol methylase